MSWRGKPLEDQVQLSAFIARMESKNRVQHHSHIRNQKVAFSRHLRSPVLSVVAIAVLLAAGSSAFAAVVAPDWNLTPGVVCTQNDPDFKGLEYPEQIARCNRNVPQEEKAAVAKNYGDIPRAEWANYEFDHLIPLCAGGSNNIGNLWPQPIEQAKRKDVLENEICAGLRDGSMTQAVAIQKVHDWFSTVEAPSTNPTSPPQNGNGNGSTDNNANAVPSSDDDDGDSADSLAL
jgi:hypothetical protein